MDEVKKCNVFFYVCRLKVKEWFECLLYECLPLFVLSRKSEVELSIFSVCICPYVVKKLLFFIFMNILGVS